jgi:hypothetical protein
MGNALVTTVIQNLTGDSIIQDGKYNVLVWAYGVLDGAVTITANVSGVTSGWTPTIGGTPTERVLNLDAVYTVTVANLTPLPIAWSMVDPKYSFAAMDRNQTVWFFQEKPTIYVFDAEIETWRSTNNNTFTQAKGPVLYINTEGVVWYSSLTARNPE